MKKRIISFLLCVVMLIGIMPTGLFTLTVGAEETEEFLEFHVQTYEQLKEALEKSSPSKTKMIHIDKTIKIKLGRDNTTENTIANKRHRTAVTVADNNIVVFSKGTEIDISTYKDSLWVGEDSYHIFESSDYASLTIIQQELDTAINLDATEPCVLFDFTGSVDPLTICGGTYYFNASHPHRETENIFAACQCKMISANLFYKAKIEDVLCNDYCFSTASLVDTNIEMDVSVSESIIGYANAYVFKNENGNNSAVNSSITTNGAAKLASNIYSFNKYRIYNSCDIYQNNVLVNESSFDLWLTGTTCIQAKSTVNHDFYNTNEDQYVYYVPGQTDWNNICLDDTELSFYNSLPRTNGITLPYTYETYSYWQFFKVVDGERVPAAFKPEVELTNGYYITKNQRGLYLYEINDMIEGGIKPGDVYVISGAVTVERLSVCGYTTVTLHKMSDESIYGGKPFVVSSIKIDEDLWDNISTGYELSKDYNRVEYDDYAVLAIWTKKEEENGNTVWKELKKGDVITPGHYRKKCIVIPKKTVNFQGVNWDNWFYIEEYSNYRLANDISFGYFPSLNFGCYACQDMALTGYGDYEYTCYPSGIPNVYFTGSVDYGDKLEDVFSVTNDGVNITASLWYHNGEIVSSDEIAGTGKYSALIKVETNEFYLFMQNARAKIFDEFVNAESVSEDGRYAFFRTPTVTLTCDHTGDTSAISSDDKNHWHVCSVCGMTYGKEEHTFDEGVISGGKTTYTCTECSFKKTVSNGKEELYWLLINTKPLTVGSKLPEITAGNYNDEKVTLIGYAWSAGTNYATAVPVDNDAVVEAGKNYYLDIDFMTKSGYYVSDETTVRLNGVTASEKTVSSGGSMINAIISQIPVYAAEATVVVPELTVGKTMEKVLDEIGESVISQNFYGVEVEITENGVKNTYYKNIYTSGWKAYSDSVPYNTFKNRTVLPGSTYSFKLHLQMAGTGYFVTEDNITIKNKSLADSVAVATTSTEVSATVIYTTEGDNKTITNAVLSVELPVTGNTPATTADAGDGNFTVKKIEWNGSPVKFAANTAYTVTLTLQPKSGFAFDPNAGAFVNGNLAGTSKNGDNLIVTYTFPKTYKVGQTVAFENETVSVAYGGTVTQTATAETAVTYSVVSGGDVASVDPSTGKVTTLKSGKAVIKATAEASDSYYSGEATYTLTVTKLDGPSAPSCTFSFDGTYAGRLIGSTSDMEYSLNGGLLWNSCIANIVLDTEDIFESFDIQIRYKATDTVNAGDIQTIDITKADAPTGLVSTDCTTEANNDGTITGVTTAMEYQKSGASGWTGIGGTTVTGLTNGTYYVRYKATGTTLASDVYTVTVNAYTENTTVSGSVTSFGSASDKITISLYETGQSTPAYTTQVTGNSTNYTLSNVAAGTYTMTVSKTNHATRKYEITVSDTDFTMDVKIHLIGDINGDGKVNITDVNKANAHANKSKFLTGYEFDCANINGDEKVNITDVNKMNAHANKSKFLW